MTDFKFVLREHAADFVTRDVGRKLRGALLDFTSRVDPAERITIDVSGVSLLTPSFVDEFFGRTAAELGIDQFKARYRIIGSEADVQSLINNVVRNRLMLQRRERAEDKTAAASGES